MSFLISWMTWQTVLTDNTEYSRDVNDRCFVVRFAAFTVLLKIDGHSELFTVIAVQQYGSPDDVTTKTPVEVDYSLKILLPWDVAIVSLLLPRYYYNG